MNTDEKSKMYPKRAIKPWTEVNDFVLKGGIPDIRGWSVMDTESHAFGKVNELLIDTEKKEVCYMDIKLNKKLSSMLKKPTEGHDDHILIPVNRGAIIDDDENVILNGFHKELLMDYPVYSGNPETITNSYEHAVNILLSADI